MIGRRHGTPIGVRLGAFDSDPGIRPTAHQYVAYAASWEPIPDDGLPQFPEARVADWRLELYGGVKHSFTNPAADELGMPGFGYDADADRRSWSAMLDLFGRVLGPP